MFFFNIILLALALYVLVVAIRGKGRLYDTKFIKDGKEKEYVKAIRIVYLFMSIVMILNSAANIISDIYYTDNESFAAMRAKGMGVLSFLTQDVLFVLSMVFLGLVVVSLVVLVVVSRKFIDKEKQQAGMQAQRGSYSDPRQQGHILPVSAFEFDEAPEAEKEGADSAEEKTKE